MEPSQGLLYMTVGANNNEATSDVEVLQWVKECLKCGQIPGSDGAYIYRATDSRGTNQEKPGWLIIWETNNMPFLTTHHLNALEFTNFGTLYRRDFFSIQSTYTIPHFSNLDLRNESATNFIVAVIIILNGKLKEEYDRYYEEEHIEALMKVPGWRRTRRFVEAKSDKSEMTRRDQDVQILQLHDYDPKTYGIEGEEFKSATSTQWYKDMMANAVKAKDRRTYELYAFVEV